MLPCVRLREAVMQPKMLALPSAIVMVRSFEAFDGRPIFLPSPATRLPPWPRLASGKMGGCVSAELHVLEIDTPSQHKCSVS